MCKTHHDARRAGALNRMQGEKWVDFSARQRAAQLAAMPAPKVRRRKAKVVENYESRLDDTGLSPDR